ncbi:hypothetical protein FHS94_000811 [Sphingomonas aerophila]|uniref:Uncharacterized protein n=1 Tax=Sphingomonas aerophila TaxID=1344948 RepID=A0A7W9BB78_9SPHN|nr:hypothetical protein [Sphingomonas aerophila]
MTAQADGSAAAPTRNETSAATRTDRTPQASADFVGGCRAGALPAARMASPGKRAGTSGPDGLAWNASRGTGSETMAGHVGYVVSVTVTEGQL